ncbi:flagellar protein FlaG [Oxalobacteraceae bacterium CAVE-383]|nr:flagellar protein FlaG [Oxalobacteraceae bacterium CAVE-383]
MDIASVDSTAAQSQPSQVVGKTIGAAPNPIVSAGLPATQSQDHPISKEDVSKAVSKLNAGPLSNSFSFSTDPDTDLSVVKITDKATGDVIRQLPSKEALALASAIDSELHDKVGQLINQKA